MSLCERLVFPCSDAKLISFNPVLPLCQFDCPSDRSSTQAPCIHAINTMFITNPSITIDCSLFQVFHSKRNEIRWDTWYDKLIIYLLHVFILSISISDVNLTTFRSSIVCDKYFRKKELCKLVISDIFTNLLNLTYIIVFEFHV